jgi:phosphinothricin acetyltransferase
MATLVIRPGEERDLEEIVRILNHYIATSHVTFDTVPFDSEARRAWFEQFDTAGRYRLLIAEDGPAIVGYAASTALRPKAAYLPSVETSIYLDPDHTGRGIGIRLYRTLLDALGREDVHRAYAGIALPNPGSVALHEALGFHHVGTFDEAGRKFDRYWSIGWWERRFA